MVFISPERNYFDWLFQYGIVRLACSTERNPPLLLNHIWSDILVLSTLEIDSLCNIQAEKSLRQLLKAENSSAFLKDRLRRYLEWMKYFIQ